VIGPEVEMGEGCHLVSHVAIEGPAKIGSDNGFFPFCSIGMAPQDITYAGESTRLEIGDHNEIREFVTINRAPSRAGVNARRQFTRWSWPTLTSRTIASSATT
jgi:UDP-N-acetylglucosamine acyltransferase